MIILVFSSNKGFISIPNFSFKFFKENIVLIAWKSLSQVLDSKSQSRNETKFTRISVPTYKSYSTEVILMLLLFSGLCLPVTFSIFLHLLINNPDDPGIFCGVLVSVRVFCFLVIYMGLNVSLFWRFVNNFSFL